MEANGGMAGQRTLEFNALRKNGFEMESKTYKCPFRERAYDPWLY
jgi:hypothetical protein